MNLTQEKRIRNNNYSKAAYKPKTYRWASEVE